MIGQIMKAILYGPDTEEYMFPKHSYCCPKCGYEPPEENYFYVRKSPINCTIYKNNEMHSKIPWYLKPFKIKTYPIYGESYHYNGPSGSGYDWKETHYCPYCKQEFIFMNGS